MEKRRLSAAAQKIAHTMSREEMQAIRRENPFVNQRNAVIRRLRAEGVQLKILAELSGLSIQRVSSISLKSPLPATVDGDLKSAIRQHRPLLKMLLKIADS